MYDERKRKMNETKTLQELTLDDLRNHTWDYSDEDIIGSFEGQMIYSYLWEVLDINPLPVRRCNLAEGWVELFETESNPKEIKDMRIVRDDQGDPMVKQQDYRGRLLVLDTYSNSIVSLDNLEK